MVPNKKDRRSGQSIMEILIAITVGVIFILGVTAAILPSISSNKQAQKIQTSAALGNELLGNLRVWSDANWNNLLALSTGTAYRYYLNTTSSPFTIATGMESIAIASGTAATSSLSTGLLGYWPLDEGTGTVANDASGNGNTGQWNGAVNYVAGKMGLAGSFNGSTTYLNMGTHASLQPNIFTVTAWIKYAGGGLGIIKPIVMFGAGAIPSIYYNSSASQFITELGGTNYVYFNSSPVNAADGNWHFVTFVVTGNGQTDIMNAAMYADGRLESTSSIVDTGSPSSKTVFSVGGNASYYFPGLIDDVRIYNRALSPSEITQLYNLAQSQVTYTRYFYLSDVYRDSSGNIVTTGGAYDPSSKFATIVYGWSNGSTNSMTTLLARTRNNIIFQTDWSGGPGQAGPITAPNNQFASSSNIKYTNSGMVTLPLPGY